MTHPWFAASPLPRVLAHRGLVTHEAASLGIVDNSFAAIAAAHSVDAAYVESDCHVTSDGVVVLFHDHDLQRVAHDPRTVAAVTARELDDLMADRGGLLTLEQALDAFPALRFNLDVKAEAAAAEVGRLVAPHADRVLVTSFSDARRRATLRRAAPRRPATSAGSRTILWLLVAVILRSPGLARRVLREVDAVQIPERQGLLRVLSRRLIDYAHRSGVEVHVWTVNDADDMRRLFRLGVDGVVTDRADVALGVARSFRASS